MDIWKTTTLILIGFIVGALSYGPTAEAIAPATTAHSFSMHMDSKGITCYIGMGSIRRPACQCPEGYVWAGWTKERLTREDNLEAICLRR
jgi:hypothetical protein